MNKFLLPLVAALVFCFEVSAGPTGQLCFSHGCCFIGARDNRANCSPAEMECARRLAGYRGVAAGWSGWNLGNCGLKCTSFGTYPHGWRVCVPVTHDGTGCVLIR